MAKKVLIYLLLLLVAPAPFLRAQESADVLNKSGVTDGRNLEYGEARQKFYQAATMYDEEAARTWHNQGVLYEKEGKTDEAMNAYEEAVHRNPKQVQSIERLGFLNYKKGNYALAVSYGEEVLELDPQNGPVKKWIYDAYRKKVDSIEPRSEGNWYAKGKGRRAAEADPHFKDGDLWRSTFYGTFDFGIPTRYDLDDKKFKYKGYEGPVTNFPYLLTGHYRVNHLIGIYGCMENPATGAELPNVCGQRELLESRFYLGTMVIGGGILFSHYKDDVFKDQSMSLMDFKIGGSLHYEMDELEIDLTFYPRLLLFDGSWSSGETYDTGLFDLRYLFNYSRSLRYYVRCNQTDYYLIDHDASLSDYYGYFEAAIGIKVDNYTLLSGTDITFGFELGNRFNLERTGSDNPYGFMNGQGLLGIDITQEGGSFASGQKSNSTLYTFSMKERFNSSFYTYQSCLVELVGFGGEEHEIVSRFGAGYNL